MNEIQKNQLDELFDSFSIFAEDRYVFVYGKDAHMWRFSAMAMTLFDLPSEYIPEGTFDILKYIHPDDFNRYHELSVRLLANEAVSYDATFRFRIYDGSYVPIKHVGQSLHDSEGNVTFIAGMGINEEKVEYHDSVTVLRNANGFFADLCSHIEQKRPRTLLMVGFSKLSFFNETYGYSYGNRLLQEVSWLIQESAGMDGNVYRMDDSKFIIMSASMSEDDMEEAYETIRRKMAHGVRVDEMRHSLRANGALVSVDDFRANEHVVFSALSFAYDESKKHRHGDLVKYEGATYEEDGDTLEVASLIRQCAAKDFEGFFLKYQPVVLASEKKVIGAEALIRWKDDDHGEVLPGQFLPILEHDYVFEEMGNWILTRAATDAKQFVDESPDFLLYVNIPAVQIRNEYFTENVVRSCERAGFPLKNLCLEISGDCLELSPGNLMQAITELKNEGAHFVIDDFGEDFLPLSLIRKMKIELVKLDRRLVSESGTGEMKAFIDLAQDSGAKVCLKGIETKEALKAFEKAEYAQGFYFGKPMEKDEIRLYDVFN